MAARTHTVPGWNGRQPPPAGARIDWSHPLAKNLMFAPPLNEGQGRCADAVTGLVSTAAAPLWALPDASRQATLGGGASPRMTSSSDFVAWAHQPFWDCGTGAISCFAIANPPNSGAQHCLVCKGNNAGSLGWYFMAGAENVGGNVCTMALTLLSGGGANASAGRIAGTALIDSKFHSFGASFGGGGNPGGKFVLVFDGANYAPTVNAGNNVPSATSTIRLTVGGNDTFGNFPGTVRCVYVWIGRQLSALEFMGLHDAPWCLWLPPLTARSFIVGAAGGAAILSRGSPVLGTGVY